jgi:hypothetical protein
LVLSLIPYTKEVHDIKEQNIEYLIGSDIMHKNYNELLDEIDNIYKNKSKCCKYCNSNFDRLNDLRYHIVVECFYKELHKRNNNNKKETIINNNNMVNSNNITNTTNINNTTNNATTINGNNNNITTNIFLDIKTPVPFDENWDISEIDYEKKIIILFNKLMYTRLLEELMKNESNLNVIIEKNSSKGVVYKNDVEKYIEMKKNDIIDITMSKLKDQLLGINNDVKNIILNEYNDFNRKIINKKFLDYKNNKDIKESVEDCMSNMFEKKKNDSIKILQNSLLNK